MDHKQCYVMTMERFVVGCDLEGKSLKDGETASLTADPCTRCTCMVNEYPLRTFVHSAVSCRYYAWIGQISRMHLINVASFFLSTLKSVSA